MRSAQGKSFILHIIKHPKGNLEKSFTLIELLIVIAILGILAAGVFIAVNPGKRSTQAKVAGAIRFAKQIDYSLAFEAAGQWDFDEGTGTEAKDTSGNNNHGAITGATYECTDTPYHVVGPGTGKCALSFDGVGDYVEVPHNAVLNPSQAITISLWLKATSLSGGNIGLMGKGPPSGQSYALRIDSDAQTRFYLYVGGSMRYVSFATSGNISTGKWYYLVGTYNSGSGLLRIYLDGELKGTTTTSGTISTTTDALSIGGTWAADNFNGTIDEVHIYSSALTTMEIQLLYAKTAPRYQIASSKSPE